MECEVSIESVFGGGFYGYVVLCHENPYSEDQRLAWYWYATLAECHAIRNTFLGVCL